MEIELVKTEWLMDNHLTMDKSRFDILNRKVSVLDIDISEQEVIYRADLNVPLTPYTALPSVEEQFKSFLEQ